MGKNNKTLHIQRENPPEKLNGDPFYGMILDEEQIKFRDAIWSKDKLVICANSIAGSGKTFVATGVASMLVHYGRYDNIIYVATPIQEGRQGFLPGDLQEKSMPYFEAFFQALETIGVNVHTALTDNSYNSKQGTAYIQCTTHTFMRGINFEKSVVIIDECQNFSFSELKKVITRVHDSCKLILLGHTGQIDIDYKEENGFVKYLNHFGKDERCDVCELKTNHRGWISSYADELK